MLHIFGKNTTLVIIASHQEAHNVRCLCYLGCWNCMIMQCRRQSRCSLHTPATHVWHAGATLGSLAFLKSGGSLGRINLPRGILRPSSLLFAAPPSRVKGKAPRAGIPLAVTDRLERCLGFCFSLVLRKKTRGQKWAESLEPGTQEAEGMGQWGSGDCEAGNGRVG